MSSEINSITGNANNNPKIEKNISKIRGDAVIMVFASFRQKAVIVLESNDLGHLVQIQAEPSSKDVLFLIYQSAKTLAAFLQE